MDADTWNADNFADPPRVVLTEHGQAVVTGAVFMEDTGLLRDLQRVRDEWENMHPEGGDDA